MDDQNPGKIREILSVIVFKILADFAYKYIKIGLEKLLKKLKRPKSPGES